MSVFAYFTALNLHTGELQVQCTDDSNGNISALRPRSKASITS